MKNTYNHMSPPYYNNIKTPLIGQLFNYRCAYGLFIPAFIKTFYEGIERDVSNSLEEKLCSRFWAGTSIINPHTSEIVVASEQIFKYLKSININAWGFLHYTSLEDLIKDCYTANNPTLAEEITWFMIDLKEGKYNEEINKCK